jgi:hypothetical protein
MLMENKIDELEKERIQNQWKWMNEL